MIAWQDTEANPSYYTQTYNFEGRRNEGIFFSFVLYPVPSVPFYYPMMRLGWMKDADEQLKMWRKVRRRDVSILFCVPTDYTAQR